MIGQNISKFLMDVAALSENKTTNDIVDISNQSSKEGIRIVIELKKDTDVENFTNMLYKKTKLEDTFGVNMLAIADGRPETMGLREIISHNVNFQFEVTRRKYTTLLQKEREKKEIQEGLIRACNVIDLIIEILRGSKDKAMAKNCLVEGITDGIAFKSKESEIMAHMLRFTERQADAILELKLYRLIGLEIDALNKDYEQTTANIYRYEDILDRRDSMAQVIINELDGIRKEFGRPRRTVIENAKEAVFEAKKIEETDVVFLMDRFGYGKVIDTTTYERNKETVHTEFSSIVSCKNTGKICMFTNTGMLYSVKVSDFPSGKLRDKGIPIDNVSSFNSQTENIVYIASQSELNLYRLLFVTRKAMLKVVDGGEFDVAKRVVSASKMLDGDEILLISPMNEKKCLVMQSKAGYFLKIDAEEIPEKKKAAVGVRGMKITEKEELEAAYIVQGQEDVIIEYKDKPLNLSRMHVAKRDTKGTKPK